MMPRVHLQSHDVCMSGKHGLVTDGGGGSPILSFTAFLSPLGNGRGYTYGYMTPGLNREPGSHTLGYLQGFPDRFFPNGGTRMIIPTPQVF